jgi:NAD(P)-dependent dehydrogenase (short-subunit alcohol dehydrogenase family)
VSSVTGEPDDLGTPGYWTRHARATVRFGAVLDHLARAGVRTYLEAGPGTALSTAGQQAVHGEFAACLRRGHNEQRTVVTALAGLHARGAQVDWARWCAGGQRIDLPGYAFQRERYWLRGGDRAPAADPARFTETWEPLSYTGTPVLAGTWLLVAPPADEELAAGAARALTEHGATVLTVRHDGPGRDDWAGRLAETSLPPLDGIVYLAGSVASTLALFQALGDAGIDAPLWAVTRGAVASVSDPAQAGVWGLGRTAALEAPDRWGGLIDLPGEMDERSWAAFCTALDGPPGEDQFAVRDSVVHARRLDRLPAPAPGTAAWQPHGTVLVTGGLGGLGAHVARWLAGRGAEHLLLVGRRGADTPGAADLRAELEALGAEVTITACDVADRQALREVLAAVPAHRPLTGIVHAAGVLDDGLIESLTPQRFDTAFAAKAGAARHLHELTRNHRLERFVLFSSFASVLGSPGQGNYAAANAVLDALAQHRSALGLPATSVAWGPWAGTGMATILDAHQHSGLVPLSPERALACLDQSLADPAAPAVVAIGEVDWDRFAAARTATRLSALFTRLTSAPAQAAPPLREQLTGMAQEQRGELLLKLVIKHVAAVSGHAADAIGAHQPFRELGMDSLACIQLRNRVNAQTGLRLATTVVYEHPTSAALARHLHSGLGEPETRKTRALAQLRHLETALSELPAEAGVRQEIGARLDAISRAWRRASQPAGDQPNELNLDTASDEEMFGLIDDVLGAVKE